MAKFNQSTKVRPDTENYAGGQAYTEDDKLALVSVLLTSFVADQYYRSGKEGLKDLVKLTRAVDPLFAAKAAVYARNEFGMRSVSHVVAGEVAASVKGEQWTKRFYEKVIARPDDVTEILSYYANAYGLHPLPNSLKKGLARALEGFDTYRLAKYQGKGKGISLVDAVNLVHPKASEALTALMNGTIAPADTWEVALSQAGQKAETDEEKQELKTEAWRRLLTEKKLGYFALLRNLRNIEQSGDSGLIKLAAEALVVEKAIRSSKVLPFRFETAMGEITNRNLIAALSDAEEIALANVPVLEGTTLVAVDLSGSMEWAGGRGRGSQSRLIDTATLFAAALYKSGGDVHVMSFDTSARYVTLNPRDSLSTIRAKIRRSGGGGTNFHAIFEEANAKYERIVILTDMQAWVGYSTPENAFKAYRKRYGVDPHLYSVDLAGYGTLQFPQSKVYALAGFSEKMFDLMAMLEQDREALVHTIEAVEI